MTSLNAKLRELKPLTFIFILSFSLFSILAFYHLTIKILNVPDKILIKRSIHESSTLFFVKAVILAPLIETFIFNLIVYESFSQFKFMKNNLFLIIFTSGIVFGVVHFYSIHQGIFAILAGMILMYGYIIKLGRRGFILVASSHAIYNLGLVGIDIFTK
jgi:hypothetical protein